MIKVIVHASVKCASGCKFRMDRKCVSHRVGLMLSNVNMFNANAFCIHF